VSVLPDTSIWVDYLRAGKDGPAGALDNLLANQAVVVCGPVLAELLAGTEPNDRDDVWHALASLPWAELEHDAWRQVGELAFELRAVGLSLPLTDLEIAVACLRAGASLWTRDADFTRLRSSLPELDLYER
jgi:predicted nucleic acid-binding protein